MSRPCDRPGCGCVAEITVSWISDSEEAYAEWIRETEDRRPTVTVSRFTGCRDHARDTWTTLRGRPRTYREI